MAGQLADQLGDHLRADPATAARRVDGEVEDVQLRFVQFVNHEADDFFALLRHHPDAVPLAQAAEEVFLSPGIFKTLLFGLEDFGHVPADHPANMDANLFLLCPVSIHADSPLLPLRRGARSPPPWAATLPLSRGTRSEMDRQRRCRKARRNRRLRRRGPRPLASSNAGGS